MMIDKWVLGISGVGDRFHDNSICLVKNGQIVFAASEERYTRVKHDSAFPFQAMRDALLFAGIDSSDITCYASGWPPLSLFKMLIQLKIFDLFLFGFRSLPHVNFKAIRVFLRVVFSMNLKKVVNYVSKDKHFFVDHHLAHASSAYRTSGFADCLTVVWDGFGTRSDGSLASGGVYVCTSGTITQVEVVPIQSSLGLFYEAVTNALGFVPAEGEGKTMGLAAYGNPRRFKKRMQRLAPSFDSKKKAWVANYYWVDTLSSVDLAYKDFFQITTLSRELHSMISESREDTAAACQEIIEEEAVKYFTYLHKRYKGKKFATAGGVFLNIKMGMKLRSLPFVDDFFVHPHAGDGGLAVGAALEIYQREFTKEPVVFKIENAAWGREFSDKEILLQLKEMEGISFQKKQDLASYTAKRIFEGAVIGWFQGRAEWGPRALGQRSVLGDPRKNEIKERINNHLKKREWFMPFAPSVLEERTDTLFAESVVSPFMTMGFVVTDRAKKQISAACHIDGTARPQSVSRKENSLYWEMISEFEKLTGVPAVLNTSFNRHGLPIVHSIKDAVDHLLWGAVDELIIGSFSVQRKI